MGFLSSLFGFDDAKPAQSTVVQATSIPEELKPFVTEVLETSQQQFQDDIAKGYTPFTGKTTADFTPEELQAMDRVTGLAGVVDPYIREAETIARRGAREFTGDEVQKYMSPYQQAVTDIEKREAQRNFEGNILPRLEAQAVLQGGGQSGLGSRAAIELSEAQRNQAQLLADIQAKGQQTAFRDAQGLFANQLAREQQLASNLGTTGTALFQSGLAEAGALEGVGANKRSQEQNLLDEAFFRFKEEEAYPQQQLAEYTQNVYGNPVLGTPSRTSTTTGTPFQPSTGQNLLGLGLTGLNIYGMGGGFGAPNPNQFSLANIYNPPRRSKAGGKVGGGLNSLPVVNRANGSSVMDSEDALAIAKRYGNTPIENIDPYTIARLKTLLGQQMEGAPQRALDMQLRGEQFNKALQESNQNFMKSERLANEERLQKRLKRNRATPLERGAAIQQGITQFMGSDKPGLTAFVEGATTAATGLSTIEEKQRKLDDAIFSEIEAYDKELRNKKQNNFIQNLKNDKELKDKLALLPEKEFNNLLKNLGTITTIGKLEAEIKKASKVGALDLARFELQLQKFGLDKKDYTLKQQTIFAKALADDLHINDQEAFKNLMINAGFDNETIIAALKDAIGQNKAKTGANTPAFVQRGGGNAPVSTQGAVGPMQQSLTNIRRKKKI
jgi:hypothetical protein